MWYVALLTASCVVLSYAGQPLPSSIKPCARSDPNLDECALKHGNEAIPHLAKGDRKYKIPVIEPFEIKELQILNDGARPSGISITLRNAKAHGIKDTVLKKTSMNLAEQHNRFEALTPKVTIVGEYEASGRILLLPISGKGNVTLIVDNVYTIFDEYWHLAPKNGENYLVRHNTSVTTRPPTNFHINIENLFNGNKFLGDQMNTFLNENWRDAYNELSPAVFKVLSEITLSIVKRISEVVPFDNIFPEKVPS